MNMEQVESVASGVLVVLDTIEDQLCQQGLELLNFAVKLNKASESNIMLLLYGKDICSLADAIAEEHGFSVLICEDEGLFYPNPELVRQILRAVAREFNPGTICLLHNVRNCQTAATLAMDLGAAVITGVESMTTDGHGIAFTRSIFNGKLKQPIKSKGRNRIVTILPGAFGMTEHKNNKANGQGIVQRRNYPLADGSYRPIEIRRESPSGPGIEEADVIIAAGRGVGKRENLLLLENTASLFHNSAIAASRPLCDLKWLPFSSQVGITGKTVAPRLYMACGISGTNQHLTGMKGAHCIVAINNDPRAAIFSVADYIVIDDLNEFLPALIKAHEESTK